MKSRAEHAVSGLIACRTRTHRRADDASTASAMAAAYDRTGDFRAMDATVSGVRGLVASGITDLPRIFRIPDDVYQPSPPQPPSQEQLSPSATQRRPSQRLTLAAPTTPRWSRPSAGPRWSGDSSSNKARIYSHEPARAVKYHCNFDLYQSPVAIWRDTLYLRIAPVPPDSGDLPNSFRFRSMEYRVVAKNAVPNVSIVCLFSTHFHMASTRMYGPIKELLSDDNPPLYRETHVRDYIKHYCSIGLHAKNYYL